MQNAFLIGSSVYLRPLERNDAPPLAGWINDPEVARTLRIYRPMSLEAEEDFIATTSKSEHDLVLAIMLLHGDRLIGAAGLHDIGGKNRHAQFGMFIGEKGEWGKGYGREVTLLMVSHAFQTLNLNRVWLHVYEDNARGRRLYEKVGFKQEGILRQENYRDGRYWDTLVMAILRAEWDAKQSAVEGRAPEGSGNRS